MAHSLSSRLALLMVMGLLTPLASVEADEIKVITTIPDLADMARQIGGDKVDVSSLTNGSEDLHYVPSKPSHLLRLSRADVLVECGLDMEHAWLPALLENSRNDAILPGGVGFVNCSAGIRPLEIPKHLGRGEGEQHPMGNPHYNVDPRNGKQMARTICDGLCRVAPEQAAEFRSNLEDFHKRLEGKIQEWEIMARPLRGTKVLTYHRSWSYFAQWLGLEVMGEVEIKPGISPTSRHVISLVRKVRDHKIPLLIKEPYYSNKYPEFLREKCGIKTVVLPIMSGGSDDVRGYFDFIEHNIVALLKALGQPVPSGEEIRRQLSKEDDDSGYASG